MKKIAKNEFEIAEVIKNLDTSEKLERITRLYGAEEVLDILGYYDNSMDKEDIEFLENHLLSIEDGAYLLGINNGNFEEAIARNVRIG